MKDIFKAKVTVRFKDGSDMVTSVYFKHLYSKVYAGILKNDSGYDQFESVVVHFEGWRFWVEWDGSFKGDINIDLGGTTL